MIIVKEQKNSEVITSEFFYVIVFDGSTDQVLYVICIYYYINKFIKKAPMKMAIIIPKAYKASTIMVKIPINL